LPSTIDAPLAWIFSGFDSSTFHFLVYYRESFLQSTLHAKIFACSVQNFFAQNPAWQHNGDPLYATL